MLKTVLATFLALCFLATLWSGYQFVTASDISDKMRSIDDACQSLLIALLDAETGQRGYIITNDPRYLAPYQAGLQSSTARLADLTRVTRGTVQEKRAEDIGRFTLMKLDELKKVLDLRKSSFALAAREVDTHLGKNLMDTVRQHLDEVELWAVTEYRGWQQKAVRYARAGFIAMLSTLALGYALTVTRDE